jgi:lipopolysaccharide transport system permease protein
MFGLAWQSRTLILSLARRDIEQRFRGSAMGMLWALANPLLMLAIYTFVFSAIFKMRWPSLSDDPFDFALMLFSGLLLFNLFSECVGRAAGLIVAQPNLVKKIVFPLHAQAWSVLLAALFQAGVNLCVFFAAMLIVRGNIPWTTAALPLVLLPMCLLVLGCVWAISALGVYLRDIGQVVGHVVTMLMFLSPLFYPIEAIPEKFRPLFAFNPLTFPIGEIRKVLVTGSVPDWVGLVLYSLGALVFAWIGFWFFQKARPGFSDVL